MGKLDRTNADVEALERLASFLGTLFVKHEITETDEKVLAAAAKRRPKLKGEWVGECWVEGLAASRTCAAWMSRSTARKLAKPACLPPTVRAFLDCIGKGAFTSLLSTAVEYSVSGG